jgi:hypothetical protein
MGPILEAVCCGPKTIRKATSPGFPRHSRSEDGEKEAVYVFRINSGLRQANDGTAAAVKQQPLTGHFDKNG